MQCSMITRPSSLVPVPEEIPSLLNRKPNMEEEPYSFLARDPHPVSDGSFPGPQFASRSRRSSNSAWSFTPAATPRGSRDVREFEEYYRHQLANSSTAAILPFNNGFERASVGVPSITIPSNLNLTTPASIVESPIKMESPPQTPVAQMSRLHEILFIINVCMAQFLALGGLAQTVAPMFIIGDSFDIKDPGLISWYTAAFSLAVGTFILPAGRIGDMYGHKRVFMLGWVWYAVLSLITGFSYAPGFGNGSLMLSVARGFQGLGPAVTVPNAMALIGTTFPPGMKKSIIFSLFGSCGPTGFVIGALISSALSQLGWWPWCFWALSIVCTLICIASFFIIPDDKPHTTTARFDPIGAASGVSGLILVNFALNQAPVVGWNEQYVPFLLGVGILFLAFFIYYELHAAKHPLVPIRGFQKEAALALACIAVGWSSHGIWLYYFFNFVMTFRGESAISASSEIAPVAILGPICALSTGFLMKKMRVAYIMLLAMVCFTIGTIFLAVAPVKQPYLILTFWSVLVMPGGMNWSFPAGSILLSSAMPKESQGMAASLVSTTVNYSISMGLGIAGTANKYVSEKHGPLAGLRAGYYLAIGQSALGMCLAAYFVWKSRVQK